MMTIQGLFIVAMLGIVYGDPLTKIIMEKIDIKMEDNPFLDTWTVTIHPGGDKVSAKVPAKKDLPTNMMIKFEISLDGTELPELEMTLCEGLEDPLIVKDMIAHGYPKGVFPTECPMTASPLSEIREWKLPSDKVPPGIPNCFIDAVMTIYEEGKPPILTATAKAKLTHQIPVFGR